MEFDFRERFTSFVLAIKRKQELLREKVAHIKLKFSDTLLIMVPRENLDSLRRLDDIIILEEFYYLNIIVKKTLFHLGNRV